MGIPQRNHLIRLINQLIDHLKQTGIMEPLILDHYANGIYESL